MTNLMKRGNFYGYPTSYRTAHCVISHDGLWFCSCKDKNCKVKRQQNPVPYQCLSDYALRYYKCIPDWLFKRNSRWFLLALFAAVIIHLLLFLICGILGKFLNLTSVEKASLIYSNAGNLIIPLVTSVLGSEWVIYSSGFMCVQTLLLWTHAQSIMQGKQNLTGKRFCRM